MTQCSYLFRSRYGLCVSAQPVGSSTGDLRVNSCYALVTALLINLGVEDLGDLKLQLTIYEDRQRQQLYSVRDHVRGCRFQHRDMEHRVDGMEVVW